MIKDAEKTIEMKQNKALSDMQSQIAELAMVAAGRIVGGDGQMTDSSMYDSFLDEVGETSGTESN